jgi:KDO2-lipid IV(A) lauroyltransferase
MGRWVGYLLLRVVAMIFFFIPFRVLYLLSDGFAFLLYHVIGYRKKVVFSNLRRVFPDKTDAEIQAIAKRSYLNLTDITLETLKLFTMSTAQLQRRCPCLNPEVVNHYLDHGQSVIISGSHYNNWEMACLTIPKGFHAPAITVYKPLSNPYTDQYSNANRARGGMQMVPMETVYAAMRKRPRDQPAAWMMVGDQSPSSRKNAHWVTFLGQKSASLPGIDVLARKFKFPVLYFHIRRLKRGFYELEYAELWPDPATASEMDITRAYAKRVETEILKAPENWLWSHKRWKMQPEAKHPADQHNELP